MAIQLTRKGQPLVKAKLMLFCSLFLIMCQLIDIHKAQQWCSVRGSQRKTNNVASIM